MSRDKKGQITKEIDALGPKLLLLTRPESRGCLGKIICVISPVRGQSNESTGYERVREELATTLRVDRYHTLLRYGHTLPTVLYAHTCSEYDAFF